KKAKKATVDKSLTKVEKVYKKALKPVEDAALKSAKGLKDKVVDPAVKGFKEDVIKPASKIRALKEIATYADRAIMFVPGVGLMYSMTKNLIKEDGNFVAAVDGTVQDYTEAAADTAGDVMRVTGKAVGLFDKDAGEKVEQAGRDTRNKIEKATNEGFVDLTADLLEMGIRGGGFVAGEAVGAVFGEEAGSAVKRTGRETAKNARKVTEIAADTLINMSSYIPFVGPALAAGGEVVLNNDKEAAKMRIARYENGDFVYDIPFVGSAMMALDPNASPEERMMGAAMFVLDVGSLAVPGAGGVVAGTVKGAAARGVGKAVAKSVAVDSVQGAAVGGVISQGFEMHYEQQAREAEKQMKAEQKLYEQLNISSQNTDDDMVAAIKALSKEEVQHISKLLTPEQRDIAAKLLNGNTDSGTARVLTQQLKQSLTQAQLRDITLMQEPSSAPQPIITFGQPSQTAVTATA
ncbi:MAG: hypothetical protein AAF621_08565, partial [Pseudomonadota bacterium]